ncbi:MAG: AI-2E family transporter [Oscillospiraceae bacterium]|nr:AI-2E family transporter [Oscillospiraceae bacterium]
MKIEWKTCAKIGISIFLLYLAIVYWKTVSGFIGMVFGAAAPLFIGAAIAYIVNILMSFYEHRFFGKTKNKKLLKTKRPLCMIIAFITLVAVIALVVWLVLPQFVSAIMLVVDYIPEAVDWIVEQLEKLEYVPQDIIDMLVSIDWNSQIEKIVKAVTSGVGNVMGVVISTVSTVLGGIVTAFLSFIFAIYILLDKEKLENQADRITKKYLKQSWYEKLRYVLHTFSDSFHKYIVGQCTEAVILGGLCAIGMGILGLPYATMIGALVAFTALIPVAGAFIGGAVGAFMILMVNPIQALIFIVYLVVLQQLEGNIIYPKVVGSSMGLPAIWVLAAVTIGGGVMGVMGMLIGVPIAATVYRIIRNDVNGKTQEEIKKALA